MTSTLAPLRRLLGPELAACLLALCAPGCAPSEQDVSEEIEAANYCSAASECRDLGSHCPFGCAVLVNEAESSRILELITDFNESNEGQQCMYSCIAYDALECQGGQCVAVVTN
jgi:hypothetical protein